MITYCSETLTGIFLENLRIDIEIKSKYQCCTIPLKNACHNFVFENIKLLMKIQMFVCVFFHKQMQKFTLIFVLQYDIKNRRIFLKRSKVDNIRFEDLFIGGTVSVHSRQLNLVQYADDFTKKQLSSKKEK